MEHTKTTSIIPMSSSKNHIRRVPKFVLMIIYRNFTRVDRFAILSVVSKRWFATVRCDKDLFQFICAYVVEDHADEVSKLNAQLADTEMSLTSAFTNREWENQVLYATKMIQLESASVDLHSRIQKRKKEALFHVHCNALPLTSRALSSCVPNYEWVEALAICGCPRKHNNSSSHITSSYSQLCPSTKKKQSELLNTICTLKFMKLKRLSLSRHFLQCDYDTMSEWLSEHEKRVLWFDYNSHPDAMVGRGIFCMRGNRNLRCFNQKDHDHYSNFGSRQMARPSKHNFDQLSQAQKSNIERALFEAYPSMEELETWLPAFSSLKYVVLHFTGITVEEIIRILQLGQSIEHICISSDSSRVGFKLKDWKDIEKHGAGLKSFIFQNDGCTFEPGAGVEETEEYLQDLLPNALVRVYERTILPIPGSKNYGIDQFVCFIDDLMEFGTSLERYFDPSNFGKIPEIQPFDNELSDDGDDDTSDDDTSDDDDDD